MTTSLAFCANTGVSRTEPIDDPQASLRVAVQWQFGPDTGSRHWLNRAKTLECNPLTVVKVSEDPATFWRKISRTTATSRTSSCATTVSSATEGRPSDPLATEPQIPRYL
jgi:hypothetical protein